MGVDFIRKAAKSFTRSWDRGRVQLATADLFTREPLCSARTIAGEIVDGAVLMQGDRLTVELAADALVARRGLIEVLRFHEPPHEVLDALHASCGVASGRIEQIHRLAGVAEVSLC